MSASNVSLLLSVLIFGPIGLSQVKRVRSAQFKVLRSMSSSNVSTLMFVTSRSSTFVRVHFITARCVFYYRKSNVIQNYSTYRSSSAFLGGVLQMSCTMDSHNGFHPGLSTGSPSSYSNCTRVNVSKTSRVIRFMSFFGTCSMNTSMIGFSSKWACSIS